MKLPSVVVLVVAAAALSIAACGGAIAPDSSTTSTASSSSSSSSSSSGGRGDRDGDDDRAPSKPPSSRKPPAPAVPTQELPTTGMCASRSALSGGIRAGSPEPQCVVSNEAKDPATGFVSIEKVKGNSGAADLKDGALLLRCDDGTRTLFQAVVRCFKGDGEYTIEPGDLVLGGRSSDRSCRLSIDAATANAPGVANVAGFIDCPTSPSDPDNVFASSGPPIGLGTFQLPQSF